MPGMYDVRKLGFNYRMTDFQAAIGYYQLKRFKKNLLIRKKCKIISKTLNLKIYTI